ncbi:hypothetical protein, partial [Brevibacillus sp. MCWH]|uniref:hypothetical protein n=1 Tax=Brevibacillus sp. MCWH TaxID=2508871 RepID=UPI0014927D1E
MSKNVIEVFNQLTHNELADYSIFQEVLGNHYEKFKYFYFITKNFPDKVTNKIKRITCLCERNCLKIIVKFSDNKSPKNYCEIFNDNVGTDMYEFKDYFIVNVEKNDDNSVLIVIHCDKVLQEEDIYEDRFNSY